MSTQLPKTAIKKSILNSKVLKYTKIQKLKEFGEETYIARSQLQNHPSRGGIRMDAKVLFVAEYSLAQQGPTLCNPMDCSPPGSSVHAIFQAREWIVIYPSRGSSRERTCVSARQTDSLTLNLQESHDGPLKAIRRIGKFLFSGQQIWKYNRQLFLCLDYSSIMIAPGHKELVFYIVFSNHQPLSTFYFLRR